MFPNFCVLNLTKMQEEPWVVEFSLLINEGGLSQVYKGTFKDQPVAIKCLKPDDPHGRSRRQLMSELEALSMLKDHPHANVGSLIAFSEQHMQLVLPYYACDLLEYITAVGAVPEPKAKILFKQMVDGVKHCHGLRIAHGDIKPENFMLKTFPLEGVKPYNPVVVLIDFGGAATEDRSSKAMCISIRYAAPELCEARINKRIMTLEEQMAADVWSMGVSLFCLLHKFLPYAEHRALEDLQEGKFGSEQRWNMSAGARALVRGLMAGDPKSRMTMETAARHHWLSPNKQTWVEWGLSALY